MWYNQKGGNQAFQMVHGVAGLWTHEKKIAPNGGGDQKFQNLTELEAILGLCDDELD